MATVNKFEELEVWQMARELASDIYKLTLIGTFAKDFELIMQIRKSSGSVMDNIAEGFERGGRKEFIHFLSISKGSAGEIRSQLYRAHDRNHISKNDLNQLIGESEIISKKLSSFINYLKNSELKGFKFNLQP